MTAPAAPPDPKDPRTIGPFTVRGLLGSGGMGRVYLADDAAGEQVAVKVIRPELADDHDFRARFRREVAAAQRVPAAVTAAVVDADTEAARPWVATRYLTGPSLAERVVDGGPLVGRELTELARGLLRGLAAVHEAGLVHRDIKPSNVILAPDGPRIIDFGIARAADSTRLTVTGSVLGTPGFMAPEQALGNAELGPACDVFALGSLLVFAATGRSPFDAPTTPAVLFRILHQEPELGDTPEPVRAMAQRCLAREPALRPTVSSLLVDLRPRWVRRSAVAVGVAAVLAVAVVLGAQLLAPGPRVETPAASTTATPTPTPAPVVDPDTPASTVAATIPLDHRTGLIAAGSDRLYVTDVDTGAISVLDTAGARVGRVDVGRFPSALVLGRDRLFVALNTAPTRIVAVDRATLAVAGGVDIGAGPGVDSYDVSLALFPDGATLAVLDPRSQTVTLLDAATLQTRASAPSPDATAAIVVSPDGTRIYLASRVDGASGQQSTGTVTVLDAGTLARLATFAGGAQPTDLALTPDGKRLFLANIDETLDPDTNVVVVLDAAGGAVIDRLTALPLRNRLIAGSRWLYAATPEEIAVVALDDLQVRTTVPIPHTVNDIATSPDRRTLYAVGDRSLTLLRSAR